MRTIDKIEKLLKGEYSPKHVDSILKHYEKAIICFKGGDWEKSILKSSKFVEATIKLICVFAKIPLPKPRKFKVNQLITTIQQLSSSALDDSLRLQITRACSFSFDLASNRGARHDPNEVDPNEMDATINCSVCSWVLAELVRISSKNVLDIDQARALVNSLVERQYPIFDNIDGRIYVKKNKYNGATECALLILYCMDKKRTSRKELLNQLKNNGINRTAINFDRLKPYVDIDTDKRMILRSSGKEKAEQIIRSRFVEAGHS